MKLLNSYKEIKKGAVHSLRAPFHNMYVAECMPMKNDKEFNVYES